MRGKWYGNVGDYQGATEVVQIDSRLSQPRRLALRLPEPILRRAHEEYVSQYPGQSFDRIQERGGFGVLELVGLLADALSIREDE